VRHDNWGFSFGGQRKFLLSIREIEIKRYGMGRLLDLRVSPFLCPKLF
jgi:hypothetical protein